MDFTKEVGSFLSPSESYEFINDDVALWWYTYIREIREPWGGKDVCARRETKYCTSGGKSMMPVYQSKKNHCHVWAILTGSDGVREKGKIFNCLEELY